jgi:hypothetical protein
MITNQRDLRRRFWEDNPTLPKRLRGKPYPVDTRMAWCDWLDYMAKSGQADVALTYYATLER